MKDVLNFIVYVAGAWFGHKNVEGYWTVGIVFGLVAVIWNTRKLADLFSREHGVFAGTSVLIYAVVYHVATRRWTTGSEWGDLLAGPIAAGVVTGSVLMPLAYRVIIGASAKAVLRTSALLIASFYIIAAAANLADRIDFGARIDYIAIMIFVWQGLYLTGLSPKNSREP